MKKFFKPRWLIWLLLHSLLYLGWRDVPIQQVWELLQGLSLGQVLVFCTFNAILVLLFNLRWWLILKTFGTTIPYLQLTTYRLASFAVSFLTPGPQFGGEPVQVYALVRKNDMMTATAFASVVLDKVIELVANFSFLAVGGYIIVESGLVADLGIRHAGLSGFLLLALPVGYLAALWLGVRPFTSLLAWLKRSVSNLEKLDTWEAMARQAEDLTAAFCRQKPGAFLGIFLVSCSVWALMVVEYQLAFSFLGLKLDPAQVVFTLVAARLALLMPMPGGLGVLEASQVLAVQALGFDPAFGVGIMLLARGRDFVLAGTGVAFLVLLSNRTNSIRKILIVEKE